MKRLLIISALFLLASCASSEAIAYEPTHVASCGVNGCELVSIHNHVYFD